MYPKGQTPIYIALFCIAFRSHCTILSVEFLPCHWQEQIHYWQFENLNMSVNFTNLLFWLPNDNGLNCFSYFNSYLKFRMVLSKTIVKTLLLQFHRKNDVSTIYFRTKLYGYFSVILLTLMMTSLLSKV